MRHYTPANGSDEPAEQGGGGVPFGVQLLAVIAGLIILVLGAKSVLQDYDAIHKLTHLDTEYKATPAKWVQVKVRQDTTGNGEYYPDVLFEYFTPEGKSVWGWKLSLEEIAKPEAYWKERLKEYRVGDTVTAHYNPKRPTDPNESFVEMRHDGLLRPLLKGAVGVAFCLFGAFLVIVPIAGWMKPKRR